MRKIVGLFLFLAVLIYSCSVVPITGRRQLSILPESEMISMGLTSYKAFMDTMKVSANTTKTAMVTEVGGKIVAAVTTYLTTNNLQNRLDGYEWEFSLIQDDSTANAFCLPGGKIVVYTGLLPLTVDKNGLAVVISHEIAHAVARHGNERMSQQLLLQMGGMALSEAVKNKPAQTQTIYGTVFGMGAQYGLTLPYSREHEYEADKLGLIFMAMAGYDPESAISFWQRMSAAGGSSIPEFLSTHPSDSKRIAAIQAAMPEILKYKK